MAGKWGWEGRGSSSKGWGRGETGRRQETGVLKTGLPKLECANHQGDWLNADSNSASPGWDLRLAFPTSSHMMVMPLAQGPHFDHKVIHTAIKVWTDPGDIGETLQVRNDRVTFESGPLWLQGGEWIKQGVAI